MQVVCMMKNEMCTLVDAALDFWLTTGRFSDEFEKNFAEWIGVKYANLVTVVLLLT